MNWEDKIIDYFNKELSVEEQTQLESQLKKNGELQRLFDDYAVLMEEVDIMPLEAPTLDGKQKIEQLIQSSARSSQPQAKVIQINNASWYKYIAAAAILLVGIMIGTNYTQRNQIGVMDQQLANLHSKMVEQLQSPSVSERIEGMQVQFASVQNSENPIIGTLIETLQKDESPNVRLAALDALDNYMDDEEVRTTLIQQLSEEQDEFVLIAMIEALSAHNAIDAIDPLRKLSTSEEVPKYVKDEAHWGLIKLEEI